MIAWAVLSVIGIVIALQVHLPPGDQSRQGGDESSILQLMLILSTPVFIGVVLFLVYSALVFRQQGKGLVDGPPSYGNLRIQVAWIATTAVVVLYLAGVGIAGLSGAAQATSFTTSQLAAPGTAAVGPSAGHELHIQVIGQQWFFTYRYPDYGGIESLHLVLPTDANIEIHVTSTDILHSFWAYELGIKADANPGVDNVFYVTTMHTGSFTVRCAELCGLWHGHMYDTSGKVVSQADFTSWISQLQTDEAGVPLPSYAPFYFPSPAVKGH
jgi:cytochrome c oxidase subunit 2